MRSRICISCKQSKVRSEPSSEMCALQRLVWPRHHKICSKCVSSRCRGRAWVFMIRIWYTDTMNSYIPRYGVKSRHSHRPEFLTCHPSCKRSRDTIIKENKRELKKSDLSPFWFSRKLCILVIRIFGCIASTESRCASRIGAT